MKPTKEVRLGALREGVFAYLSWVPAEGYAWRDDLEPWPPWEGHLKFKGYGPVDPKTGLPHWIELPPDPPPYLVGPAPPGIGSYHHPRAILHEGRHRPDGLHPGLHGRFAELGDAQQMKRFADRYGDLGQGGMELRAPDHVMLHGESFALWQRETDAMARLLRAWDKQDPDSVREVREAVNRRLRGHVNPHILPADLDAGYRIIFIPDSLLAALYVLFALQVAEEEPRRQCVYCHQVFTTGRRDQQYCSVSCRRNASYHRVKAEREGQA
jgi:hypothetical protein